jgi:energy-coupling factor transport system permease protein
MMALSNVPPKIYFRSISNLKVLIIFLLAITMIFGGSWYTAIITIIKIVLGISYTMILTYTTSKSEITYGLEQVFKPLSKIGVPVKQLSLTLTLALRFIPTVFEKTDKIMKSQASRGIDFKHTNLKGKVIAISSMIVPMFVLSFKKADAIADAMEVRLYNCNAKRTNYRFNKWSRIDDNIIIAHIIPLIYLILRGLL